MKDISNKTLAVLLILTIVVSLGGTFISLSIINSILKGPQGSGVTGFALTPNATTTLTVDYYSSITFTQASIAFGSGSVNTTGGYTNCTLSSVSNWDNTPGCIDFTQVSTGFTIQNDGNTNLTVELASNVSAFEFIGSDGATFLWNVTLKEAGSCVNSSANGNGAVFPNTSSDCLGPGLGTCGSIFEDVSTNYKVICPRLLYEDSNDELDVDVNISIPYNSPTGGKSAAFTVRGTKDPLV